MNVFCTLGINGQQTPTFRVSPQNDYFVLDEDDTSVQFNCSIDHINDLATSTIWTYVQSDGTVSQISNNNFTARPEKYAIEGEYNLVIQSVQAEDAKMYICQNEGAGALEINALVQLFIIGKIVNQIAKLCYKCTNQR